MKTGCESKGFGNYQSTGANEGACAAKTSQDLEPCTPGQRERNTQKTAYEQCCCA